jgi:hypothetical protein
MSQADDERQILGWLLRYPGQYGETFFPEHTDPIGALDFKAKVHRQLFSLIRTHYLPHGDLANLIWGCEAKKLRGVLTQQGFEEAADQSWGWYEHQGGDEWLSDLMREAPEDISDPLGRFLERRPISQRQAHELVV